VQLCDRAILLKEGEIVRHGDATDVVAHYEQEAMGTGPEAFYHDPAEAPGNDLARLQSVRVVDENGTTQSMLDVRRPIGIEIAFEVLRDGWPVVPKVKLFDQHWAVCFNAMDVDPRWHEPAAPGEYVATAWIPPNLLNEGRHQLDADVVTIASPKVIPHFHAHRVVAFHVFDPGEGDTARGTFQGQWKGVVRPLLDWTCEER
jgi:lipopolysaccharide transport system ATP-binding protein